MAEMYRKTSKAGSPGKRCAVFPGADTYSRMKRSVPVTLVRESGFDDGAFHHSERHLQCVWFDSKLRPPDLRTAGGEKVTVDDPGRWNLEAGPDFLDATIVIGPERRRVKGDVEIHVRPGDWEKHGHSGDRAYSGVIAHVSFFPGIMAGGTLPSSVVQIALKDAISAVPGFSFESIDLTAYPYGTPGSPRPPCAIAMEGWSQDRIALLIESAGEDRLRGKSMRMARAMGERGESQVFYEEIMCALGYKHNRTPFRQLAERVPLEVLRNVAGGDPEHAYSLLLGAAGLIPEKMSTRWDEETRRFVRRLWDFWWKQKSRWDPRTMDRAAWRMSGIRPQNSPVRRLAAAAGLFGGKSDLLKSVVEAGLGDQEQWMVRVARAFIPAGAITYWRRRLSLSGALQKTDIELVGEGRICAMVSNVLIPYLAAIGGDVAALCARIPPEDDNALTRQTAFLLLGRDHNPLFYRSGIRQQGLMQIFQDFCLNNRSACAGCALALAIRSASTIDPHCISDSLHGNR